MLVSKYKKKKKKSGTYSRNKVNHLQAIDTLYFVFCPRKDSKAEPEK